MSIETQKTPGPDHPISIAPQDGRVVVRAGGQVVADTSRALVLQEASYPAVFYVPRADVDLSLLEKTSHSSHCPYKGDASYYSITPGGPASVNAIWSYETPYPAAAQIAGHMAFYPDRVDAIDLS